MPRSSKYDKLVSNLRAGGARDPRALAAHIGRTKLGKEEFQRRAQKGRMVAEYKRRRGIK